MSAASAPSRPRAAPPAPPGVPAGTDGGTSEHSSRAEARTESLVVRLASFAALAAFAAGHWGSLVAAPPALRVAGTVALATGLGAILSVVGRSRLRSLAGAAIAAPTAIAALVAALLVTGVPQRLLAPSRLGELAGNVDAGLAGIRTADWPYAGPDEWVRLSVLLGAPLVLTVAAALAFWPVLRPRVAALLRAAALLLLLALYAIAVTENDPGAPLLRGLLLLALVAAWLWLPRLRPREAAPGAAIVLAVGLCSLPLAARLDDREPWIDYTDWRWFGAGRGVEFDWAHSYGPLDWPREGTTLLRVRSDRPHYWKAETLDAFDGVRWTRSLANAGRHPSTDLPANPRGRWFERLRFTVRSLRSELVVGAGTIFDVEGVGPTATGGDGTTLVLARPLQKGDAYTVRAYAPDPSARTLRAAPDDPSAELLQYTSIVLPASGRRPVGRARIAGDAARTAASGGKLPVTVPLRADPLGGDGSAERRLRASAYREVYRLARRLTAQAPTSYDAVKRVADHLRERYDYSEVPPRRSLPLAAFLFRDRVGYCQQFSGAMALMLRMAGIPSRVATGFSPGSRDEETGEHIVSDTDAHSWVEVYFGGIGWVPFDPTPSLSPARSQAGGGQERSAARGEGEEERSDPAGEVATERGADSPGAGSPGGDDPVLALWTIPLGIAALAGAVGLAALARGRRGRRAGPMGGDPPELRELGRAVARLDGHLRPSTTLLGLERGLALIGAAAAAGYVRGLREQRFAGEGRRRDRPGRRALRRTLASGARPLGRARALVALPPGGPWPGRGWSLIRRRRI